MTERGFEMPPGPHGVPDLVDFRLQLTGHHDSFSRVSMQFSNLRILSCSPFLDASLAEGLQGRPRWRPHHIRGPSLAFDGDSSHGGRMASVRRILS